MAAIQLVVNTPDVAALTANTRQRYLMPASGAATWVRIYSASACYLELADVADTTSLGTDYETIPAGIPTARQIRRGEFAISGSASQNVEVTAATKPGPG